jgi:hypothetical protein
VTSASRRGVLVQAACSKRCRITAAGVLSGGARTTQAVRDADAGRVVTLRLALSRSASAAVRDALAHGRRVRAQVVVVAVDNAGRAGTARRSAAVRG